MEEKSKIFAAHLLVAFAQRTQGRAAEADATLAQARQLLPAEHPLGYLMPTADEWDCKPPTGAIEEIVPGAIWRISGYYTHGPCPFHEFMYATLVRLGSGALVLINPVAMSPEIISAVRQLGEVTHILAPVKFHSLFIAAAQKNFPAAKCFGVPGHRKNPPSAHLHFDGFLGADGPSFGGELELLTIQGHDFEETAFFHPASRTAIFHDLLLANHTGVPGFPFWYRLYTLVFGIHQAVGFASYQTMLWTNPIALRRSLKQILAWDSERVLLCHAPAGTIPTGGQAVLRQALGWASELAVSEYLVLVSAFFRRQPSFLRDFVVYLIKQSGKKPAAAKT